MCRARSGTVASALEVDRGVDFPALSFLYETIDQSQWTVRSRKTSWTIWPSPLSGCFPRTFDLLRRPSGKKHVRPGRVAERETRRLAYDHRTC